MPPCLTTIAIYSPTESVGATGEVVESLTLVATAEGYMYAHSPRWGHYEDGNGSEGDTKAMLPLLTTVNAGHVLTAAGLTYRAVRVWHPGNHHTEVLCARM